MSKPFFINHMMIFDPQKIHNAGDVMKGTSGNTGNSYITYSLVKELYNWNCDFRGIQNIWAYDYSQSERELDYINNEADTVFLNLQDHIRPVESQFSCDYEKLNDFVKKIKKQVNVIGIGANCLHGYDIEIYKRLPESLKNLLYTLADKTSYIGVRGEFTANVLEKLGISNVKIIGCPTFYETGKNHIVTKKNIVSPNEIVFTNIYKLGVVEKQPVILQSESDIMDAVLGNPLRFFGKDAKFDTFWNTWIDGRFKFFTSVTAWKEFIKPFKFALGSRVHGGVIAMNSGCPAVCLNGDARSREMCSVLKMPCLPEMKASYPMKIWEKAEYDEYNKNYNKIYENYVDFIKSTTGLDVISSSQDSFFVDDIDIQKHFCESFGKKIAKLCYIQTKENEQLKVKKTSIDKVQVCKFDNLRIRLLSHITFGKTKQYYQKKWREIKKVLKK